MIERTEALRRLRAADPARGVEIPQPDFWTAPVEDAPVVAELLPRVQAKSHRPRRAAALLAAAAIVAGLAVGGVELIRGTAGTRPADSVAPVRPAEPTSPQLKLDRVLERLFATTPVLDGAIRQASSPVPFLSRPHALPTSSHHTLDTYSWWTAPSWTPKAAYVWYRDHRPHGVALSSWSAPGVGHLRGRPLWLVTYRLPDTAYSTQAELNIQIVRHGSGVAVRADAYGIWLSPRRATR